MRLKKEWKSLVVGMTGVLVLCGVSSTTFANDEMLMDENPAAESVLSDENSVVTSIPSEENQPVDTNAESSEENPSMNPGPMDETQDVESVQPNEKQEIVNGANTDTEEVVATDDEKQINDEAVEIPENLVEDLSFSSAEATLSAAVSPGDNVGIMFDPNDMSFDRNSLPNYSDRGGYASWGDDDSYVCVWGDLGTLDFKWEEPKDDENEYIFDYWSTDLAGENRVEYDEATGRYGYYDSESGSFTSYPDFDDEYSILILYANWCKYTVTWDGEGALIGTYDWDPIAQQYQYTNYQPTYKSSFFRHNSGDTLDEFIFPSSEQLQHDHQHALLGWRVGDTDTIYKGEYNANTRRFDYQDYVITGDITMHAVWTDVVPLQLHANGYIFGDGEIKLFKEFGGRVNSEGSIVRFNVLKGDVLKSGVPFFYDEYGDIQNYFIPSHIYCTDEDMEFNYWTIGSSGGDRVTIGDSTSGDIYIYDKDGNKIIAGDDVLLYAHWYPCNDPNIVFEGVDEDREVDGEIFEPMTLKVKASYVDTGYSISYEWWNDDTLEDLIHTEDENDGYSSCRFIPELRYSCIGVTATVYDGNHNIVSSKTIYINIDCNEGASVTNTENHIKIARNGSKTLTVNIVGTVGDLEYNWHRFSIDDEENIEPLSTSASSSYTVKNYTDSSIVYACSVSDDYGFVDCAYFYFTFCNSHTGNWVVTKAPTVDAEGVETRTCSTCGSIETRAIAKLPAPTTPMTPPAAVTSVQPPEPITISKAPAMTKPKAAKGKVTFNIKKFKQTKKTKKLWKQIRQIEFQYSTDPSFPKDNTTTKLIGKNSTKQVVRGKKGTVIYARARYTDGAGGVSNWGGMKKAKIK